MQSLYGSTLVSGKLTRGAMRIVDQALTANGVTRAADLPEEARVRLFRRLSAHFRNEPSRSWLGRLFY